MPIATQFELATEYLWTVLHTFIRKNKSAGIPWLLCGQISWPYFITPLCCSVSYILCLFCHPFLCMVNTSWPHFDITSLDCSVFSNLYFLVLVLSTKLFWMGYQNFFWSKSMYICSKSLEILAARIQHFKCRNYSHMSYREATF